MWCFLAVCFCSSLYQHEHHRHITHLHLDWSNVLVCCSTAGLGQLHRSVLKQQQTNKRNIRLYFKSLDLSSVLCSLDRGYGTCEVDWSKANYSTIYKSYIISILIFCFFIPVMIMLFSYISIINTVKSTNAMSADGLLTSRQRKVERDVTRVGKKNKSLFLEFLLKSKMRFFAALLKSAVSVINLLSRYSTPDNCSLMFLSRFPLWSAQLSSWPGRHMQWCLCGQPGAFMCQAQPASSPVSLPSLPVSTTRSSTLAWAPSFARTSLCCYHAHEKGGSWCICNTLKTWNQRLRLHPNLSRSWRRNTPWESRTNPIMIATQGSTALLRLLHVTRRRSSTWTWTCPPTLKHQSTGVTGSKKLELEYLNYNGRLRVFLYFLVLPVLINTKMYV